MFRHDQLTVREIRGPYMQLLTNLQGENGHEWLEALKAFNSRKNPWFDDLDAETGPTAIRAVVDHLEKKALLLSALHTLTSIVQEKFSCGRRVTGIEASFIVDNIMRGVASYLQLHVKGEAKELPPGNPQYEVPSGMAHYITNNIRQGLESLEGLMREAS